jgi:UDP-2,3-diacylglucosamine pyrophosphatase LpxH
VLIADAHVSRSRGNADAFFRMLAALERGPGDVVFLGDIFDLWVALPRYEDDLHRAFLSWCRQQKMDRRVGFVEGNHEFFLAQTHAGAFTWCTQHAGQLDAEGLLFSHGDRINRRDRNYRLFRRLTKNPAAKMLMAALPFGPRLVHHIKLAMKGTNQQFRKNLPVNQLHQFAEACFAQGTTRIFMGHFHHGYHYRGAQGGDLHTLPDWFSQGWISVLPSDRSELLQGHWQGLLPIATG